MKRIVSFCRWWLFIGFVSVLCTPVWGNQLNGIRIWPAPDKTRVVVDMATTPVYSYFTLTEPNRLVVDLKQTDLSTGLPVAVEKSEVLTLIRHSSPPESGTYRLVFELNHITTPTLFALKPTPDGTYGHRLVIDLPHKTKPAAEREKSKPAASSSASAPLGVDDIVIAIDPGHGGEDPGSIGPSGRYEKDVTLNVSRKLANKINAIEGMRAVLTRDGDYYVNLNQRTEIARKERAHLLISVHADGFHQPQPRGASVWVLSTRRANSEIGRWIEQHEKQSELLGGGDVLSGGSDDQYLSMAVLDLQFSHSQREGYDVATRVLSEMRKITTLHKSKPEHASLAVLKSPDIPSLLVETGFITNPTEEQLLFNRTHQDKLAVAILNGVEAYFDVSPPDGTLWASRRRGIRHTVTSGESLSKIAQRYGTTASELQRQNNLSTTTLKVGQTLSIPTRHIPTTTVAEKGQTVVHVVQRGEFLGKIAERYAVSVQSIRDANRLRSDGLAVGQKLTIEGATQGVTAVVASLPISETLVHTVVGGDYLGKIAEQYGVSVTDIRQTNKLRSDQLRVGQKLTIRSSQAASSSSSALITYTVKRGDFLGRVAQAHNVSAESIRVQNNLKNDKLLVGQKLKIATTVLPPISHTVQRGEFLGKIASQYGVTIDSLRRANRLRSDELAIGQVLTIPSS